MCSRFLEMAKGSAYIRSATRWRSSGSTSASNQGFLRIQTALRQAGWGRGKTLGRKSRKLAYSFGHDSLAASGR